MYEYCNVRRYKCYSHPCNNNMSSNKIHTSQAFKNHWILWKCCGLQPPERDSKWYMPYIVYAIFFNITVTLFFPTTLIVNCAFSENLMELCENLYVTITDVVCNFKFINIFIIRHKLLKVHQILDRLDVRAKTPEERQELRAGIQLARKWFMVFLRLYTCAVISSQLVVYLAKERVLMYPAWFPWNWKASKRNFLWAHCYQVYGLTCQSLQNLGSDTYPQAYMVILIAQIRALGKRIKAVGSSVTTLSVSEDKLHRELIDCVKDHETVQELFITIEETISSTCFAQFIATGLAQCTIGVYMICVGFDLSRLLNIFMFFIAVTFEIFILCYYGDLYCRANDFLIAAIYDCNWMDRNEKFKGAILLLLQRAQQTKCIMAGKLIPVRLPTFVRVMKTAYSAFTVLNKVN